MDAVDFVLAHGMSVRRGDAAPTPASVGIYGLAARRRRENSLCVANPDVETVSSEPIAMLGACDVYAEAFAEAHPGKTRAGTCARWKIDAVASTRCSAMSRRRRRRG